MVTYSKEYQELLRKEIEILTRKKELIDSSSNELDFKQKLIEINNEIENLYSNKAYRDIRDSKSPFRF